MCSQLRNERGEVLSQRVCAAVRAIAPLGIVANACGDGDHVIRPALEQAPIGRWQAQDLGNHDHRQRVGEAIDQIPFALIYLGELFVDNGSDPWPQRLDPPRRECAVR